MPEEKLSLLRRTALAAKLATKIIRADETKGDPIFPKWGGSWGSGWFGGAGGVSIPGTNIDFRSEVGDLATSSLAMAVVNFVGTMLSEAPPAVQEEEVAGTRSFIYDSPVPQLVEQPNPYHTGDAFWLAFALSWYFDGNVYWLKQRSNDKYKQVTALWYLPHFMVEPRWDQADSSSFITKYRYSVGGAFVDYDPEDIIHFRRGINLYNQRVGVGAFGPVLRELYGDNAAATFSAVVLKNWGVVPYIVSPKPTKDGMQSGFSADGAQALATAQMIKELLINSTTGDKAGQPVVNTIPLDVQKLGFSPADLDISRLRLIPESRIAAITGIPAAVLQFMVGLQNGTSYASYEQAIRQAYHMAIKPIVMIAQSTLQQHLMSDFGSPRGLKQFFIFDLSKVQVLQEDQTAVVKREQEIMNSGGTTINQFLTAIGRPTEEGLDIRLIPNHHQPMSNETLIALASKPPVAPNVALLPGDQQPAGAALPPGTPEEPVAPPKLRAVPSPKALPPAELECKTLRDVSSLPTRLTIPSVFTGTEIRAIAAYTNGAFGDINTSLRGSASPSEATQEYIRGLDSALTKSRLPDDSLLYRLLTRDAAAKLAPGMEFVDECFVSCTYSEETAQRWARSSKGQSCVAVIQAPRDFPAVLGGRAEQEIILPRGQFFRVVAAEDDQLIVEIR